MPYLYQKDKRALPGNLQNRRYSFLPHQCSVSHYHPHFLFFRRDQRAEARYRLQMEHITISAVCCGQAAYQALCQFLSETLQLCHALGM
jgi:hypothetical protein